MNDVCVFCCEELSDSSLNRIVFSGGINSETGLEFVEWFTYKFTNPF